MQTRGWGTDWWRKLANAKAPKRRKPTRPTPKPKKPKSPPVGGERVAPASVLLVSTAGGAGTGGGAGGHAWTISVGGKRAGRVFINFIDEPPVGPHASIQIFLNAASQGRGIGRVGYRKACEASAYGEVYAHIRKSNLASIHAALAAGFVDVTPPEGGQTLAVWRRLEKK